MTLSHWSERPCMAPSCENVTLEYLALLCRLDSKPHDKGALNLHVDRVVRKIDWVVLKRSTKPSHKFTTVCVDEEMSVLSERSEFPNSLLHGSDQNRIASTSLNYLFKPSHWFHCVLLVFISRQSGNQKSRTNEDYCRMRLMWNWRIFPRWRIRTSRAPTARTKATLYPQKSLLKAGSWFTRHIDNHRDEYFSTNTACHNARFRQTSAGIDTRAVCLFVSCFLGWYIFEAIPNNNEERAWDPLPWWQVQWVVYNTATIPYGEPRRHISVFIVKAGVQQSYPTLSWITIALCIVHIATTIYLTLRQITFIYLWWTSSTRTYMYRME